MTLLAKPSPATSRMERPMREALANNRAERRIMKKTAAKLPKRLTMVPRSQWPLGPMNESTLKRSAVWVSRDYLVQLFDEGPGLKRLSVNLTQIVGNNWADGIGWDELQDIKNQCGFPDTAAIEIYPPERDKVAVANMRHLWLMETAPAFMWRRD